MSPKRTADLLDDASAANKENAAAKKARVSEASESVGSVSKTQSGSSKLKDWHEVVLMGEEEGMVPVYDDCNDVRRKIRLLLKQPGFKLTHWLRDIGDINYNSYQRFMKATGPTGGAANGTYYAAYVYFEKVRIAQGKKKTAKRERNELGHPNGFPLEDRRCEWVRTY